MDSGMYTAIWFVVALLIGIVLGWFIARKVWTVPVVAEQDAENLRQRLSAAEARNVEHQAQQNRDAQRLATLQEQLNAGETRTADLERQSGTESARAQDQSTQLTAAEGRSAEMEQQYGSESQRVIDLQSELAAAAAEVADLQQRLGEEAAKRTHLEAQLGTNQKRTTDQQTQEGASWTRGTAGGAMSATAEGTSGSMSGGESKSESGESSSTPTTAESMWTPVDSGTTENVTSGSAYTNRDIGAELQSSESVTELHELETEMGIDAESLPTQDSASDSSKSEGMSGGGQMAADEPRDIGEMRASRVEGPGFSMGETTHTAGSVADSSSVGLGDAGPGGADPGMADDLTEIQGIGPVIARRLHEAGVHTFRDLAELDAEQLRDTIGDVISTLANEDEILDEARRLADNREQQE